jgi:GDPmannose 4,6-dehydratase
MHISNGILFNHTSPRRGETFVERKITKAAARIAAGQQRTLFLGNVHAQRDWGYAPNYVRAMWLMLQNFKPDDYVIATGFMHSVTDVLDAAFGFFKLDWREYVRTSLRFARPNEVTELCGDATRARAMLGWAQTMTFDAIIATMCEADRCVP